MKIIYHLKLTSFLFFFVLTVSANGQTITLLHSEKVGCDDEVRRFEKIGDHFYYEFQNEYRNKENRGIFELRNDKVYPVELKGLEKFDSSSVDFFYSTRLFTMNDYYEISDTSGVFVALESGGSSYAVFSNGKIIIKKLEYEDSSIAGLYNDWFDGKLITYLEQDYSMELVYFDPKELEFKKLLSDSIQLNFHSIEVFDSLLIGKACVKNTKEYKYYSINRYGDLKLLNHGGKSSYFSMLEEEKLRFLKYPDLIKFTYGNEVYWDHRVVFAALDTLEKLRFVLFDVRNQEYIVSEDVEGEISKIMLIEDECFFTTKDSVDHFTLHSITTDGKTHRMDLLTFYRRITTLERFRFKNEEYLIIGDEKRSNLYKYNPATYALELVFSNIINTINQGYRYKNESQANIVVTQDQVYFIAQIGEKFDTFGVFKMQ